mgnify:CR=1 FL=1
MKRLAALFLCFVSTALAGEGAQAPWLTWQRDPTTTMTVSWLADDAGAPATVHWRKAGGSEWRTAAGVSVPFPHTRALMQRVELTGLDPGALYEFRVGDEAAPRRFRTLPARLAEPLTFVEGGDVYQDATTMDRVNKLAASFDPAFVVMGGDLAYDNGLPANAPRWERFLRSIGDNLVTADGRHIPVLVAIGNHEVRRGGQTVIDPAAMPADAAARTELAPGFFAAFPFPGERAYGVLDAGDYLSLLMLDTNHLNSVGGEQTLWLGKQLASRGEVPHVFPVYHVPAYPSVRNPNDPVNIEIRKHWLPLFEKAGVKLAFEHHDHAFKVTYPIKDGRRDPDGIVFLGDGAWGVPPRADIRKPGEVWYIEQSQAVNHVHVVTIAPAERTVRSIDDTGREIHVLQQTVKK